MNRYRFDSENHIHLLDERPLMGTTTILKEVYPPFLSWWASRLALEPLGRLHHEDENKNPVSLEIRVQEAAKFLKELCELNAEEYLDLLDNAYRAHDKKKKAEGKKGIEAHDEVEDYIKRCIAENGGKPLAGDGGVKQFSEWAFEDVKKFVFSEACVYSEKLWVGGIADYGFIDKRDRFIIGDRKTAKAIYNTSFYQTAGYGIQLWENGAFTEEGEKILEPLQAAGYCIFQQKGGGKVKVQYRYDAPLLERIFINTVEVYKDKKNYQ